jgi:CubicO group peptidase (beta-lactamase class C family)
MRNALLLAALTLVVLPLPARAAEAPPGTEAVVREGMKAWRLPGLAVAVVRDGEVIYLRGHGLREVGNPLPVTPDTLFAIASLTKAFTATALAILIDEGKASWDDPVRKHLPWFRLADPLANRDVTLRDLLCHRSGLARHDMLWYRAPWSLEETARRMAFLPPTASFRARYQYANLPYIAAGLAVAAAAKQPWDEVVRARLFVPLGMKGAVFTRSAALAAPDHATPHRAGRDGKQRPIEWYPDDKQVRGSGSIKASARDMTAWLKLQLNGGAFDGKRVVSARALAETHTAQVVTPIQPGRARLAGTTQATYGLGWQLSDYRGLRLREHGGSNDGFRARILLFPEKKLGLVLLTNCDEDAGLQATALTLADHLLGLKKRDWHGQYRALAKKAAAARAATRAKKLAARKAGTRPTLAASAYAGKYRDPAYGELEVRAGGGLELRWSSFALKLEHWHYNTFAVADGGPARGLTGELVTFALGADGRVAGARFLGRAFVRAK